MIENSVSNGSIIVMGEWQAYKGLANNYPHILVNHKENQYVSGAFHTNGIENFWSLLKRGIYEIYHHASPKHLHRYCDEFAFRFNARKESSNERFNFPLINSPKFTYKQLVANEAGN